MPAFSSLEADDLNALVVFVHDLHAGASGTERPTGDPSAGRKVYEASGCSGCHRIGRAGNVFGPDLTRVGASRSLAYLKQSLVDPSADIPDEFIGISVVTKTGKHITGVRINEDTFTVQIRDQSQEFRNFEKSDLESETVMKRSLMPPYRLPDRDLENLIAYLASLKGGPASGEVKQREGIR